MRGIYLMAAVVTLTGVIVYMAHAAGDTDREAEPIFGVKIPPGYRDWKLISVAHEEGNNNDLRAVLGNDVAIRAYREGKLPFPQTAPLLPGWPGVTSRPSKTTRSLAVLNLSLLGRQSTCS